MHKLLFSLAFEGFYLRTSPSEGMLDFLTKATRRRLKGTKAPNYHRLQSSCYSMNDQFEQKKTRGKSSLAV